MCNAYIKDETDEQLSQTPYEDQLSDVWSLASTPVSQSNTSLSSTENSQCSSGYCSDNSYGRSVSLKSSQLPYSKHTSKRLPNKEGEQNTYYCSDDNVTTSSIRPFSIQVTSPTISDTEISHTSIKSLENGSMQRKLISSTKGYKNVLHSSLQKSTLPPESCTYNTKVTRIPKPSSGKSTFKYCTSNSYYSPATECPSTLQDAELVLQSLLVFSYACNLATACTKFSS